MRYLFLFLLTLVFACGKDEKTCPGKSITGISPNNNPVGYEVLLETEGFTDAAVVRFGQSVADSRAGGEAGQLIARVPTGLAGNVQVTVEEGDCLDRFDDFQVLGSYPGNLQPALQNILIAIPGSVPAPAVDFTNSWKNAADSSQTAGFFLKDNNDGIFNPAECNETPPNSSQTNPISGTYDLQQNKLVIVVQRPTADGGAEEYDGQFINKPAGVPNLPDRNFYLLFISRKTGRQVLLYPS